MIIGGLKSAGIVSGASPTFGQITATGEVIIAPTGQEVVLALDSVDNSRFLCLDQSTLTSASAPYIGYNSGNGTITIAPAASGNVTFSIASGQNIGLTTAGARLKLSSAGTTDYFTSDGFTVIYAAGGFGVSGGVLSARNDVGSGGYVFQAGSAASVFFGVKISGERVELANGARIAYQNNSAPVAIVGDTTSPARACFTLVPQDNDPTGPNEIGDMYVTTAGVLKICTSAGSPGTWTVVGTQT